MLSGIPVHTESEFPLEKQMMPAEVSFNGHFAGQMSTFN